MRVVRLFDILLSYLLVLLCGAGLVAGIFDVRYFLGAGAAFLMYLVWGFFRLRCPWCGESVDSARLLRGLWRTCNCPNCGHEIIVVPFVSHGTPAKLRRARAAAAEEPIAETPEDVPAVPETPSVAEAPENEEDKAPEIKLPETIEIIERSKSE